MKKAALLCLVLLSTKGTSQNYLSADTLNRHEICASVLPFINVFSGSVSGSTYVNFNFGYKYYLKNNYVFRSALVLFPRAYNMPYGAGLVYYDRTAGPNNVFYSESYGGSIKTQLNIGVEKIFKMNRLMHGFGVDAFVNHSRVNYAAHYFYRPGYISNNNFLYRVILLTIK